jgi:hypothetical protein
MRLPAFYGNSRFTRNRQVFPVPWSDEPNSPLTTSTYSIFKNISSPDYNIKLQNDYWIGKDMEGNGRSLIPTSVLPSYPCFDLRSNPFSSGFPTKILYAFMFHLFYVSPWFHCLDMCRLCNFLQPPVSPSLLGPNISSTPFSNFCSVLNVR